MGESKESLRVSAVTHDRDPEAYASRVAKEQDRNNFPETVGH